MTVMAAAAAVRGVSRWARGPPGAPWTGLARVDSRSKYFLSTCSSPGPVLDPRAPAPMGSYAWRKYSQRGSRRMREDVRARSVPQRRRTGRERRTRAGWSEQVTPSRDSDDEWEPARRRFRRAVVRAEGRAGTKAWRQASAVRWGNRRMPPRASGAPGSHLRDSAPSRRAAASSW